MGHLHHRHHHPAHDRLLARLVFGTVSRPTSSPSQQYHCYRHRHVLRWVLVGLISFLINTGHGLEQLSGQQEPQADQQPIPPTLSSTSTPTPTLPPCEQRALDDIPPDPFYDVSDITISAAKSFADFLASRKIDGTSRDDRKFALAREKANELATSVLKQDDGLLLAVGIAYPRLPLAVVQFRDQIDSAHVNLSESKNFLSTYWRELGAAWNQSNGAQFWGAPFRDCGPLYGRWLWPYSVTVESQGVKIVASAFIAADVDQCNDALESIFGRRHVCDRESTFCLLSELDASKPRGKYTCVCRPGYYIPNESIQGFSSEKDDGNITNFSCIPCPSACECDSEGSCSSPDEDFSTETLMKATIGAILGACMLCCLVLALIVFRQRKCKTIATGMWTILETILFGILLLYLAVISATLSGTSSIMVELLMRMFIKQDVFVLCDAVATNCRVRNAYAYRTRGCGGYIIFIWNLKALKLTFNVICIVMLFQLLNMLQLEYLRVVSRSANVDIRPSFRKSLVRLCSVQYPLSGSLLSVRRERLESLFLPLRTSMSVCVRVFCLFCCSFWMFRVCLLLLHRHSLQVRSLAHDVSFRLPVDAFKGAHESTHHGGALGTYAGICMGDPEVGDVTISEMSPEDIRAELKRLYTQLEYLKNKTLRQDNPHISKRRGGRKVAHRRFSLQALSAKHRHNRPAVSEVEVTEAEPSRTPEDSVCSVEGPTDTGTGTGEISGISSSK
uniref:GPR158/179 extracellular domain-containing protein n=1 Tax=Anopheles coluzzii TaxID=1518534 RepID=A0A6E8W059_ANOCL